jgi:thioesterase domain-containing protein
MARQLAADGDRTAVVVMADTPFPAPIPTPGDHLRKLFSNEGPRAVARRLRGLADRVLPQRVARADRPVSVLEARARELAAYGVDLHATIMRERRYVSEPRPPVAPVALLRCRHTMEVICRGSPVLNWERYVDDDWEVHEVPGSHDSMLGEPHVHVLAAILKQTVLRAQERELAEGGA